MTINRFAVLLLGVSARLSILFVAEFLLVLCAAAELQVLATIRSTAIHRALDLSISMRKGNCSERYQYTCYPSVAAIHCGSHPRLN
jgi:hypothetical protein